MLANELRCPRRQTYKRFNALHSEFLSISCIISFTQWRQIILQQTLFRSWAQFPHQITVSISLNKSLQRMAWIVGGISSSWIKPSTFNFYSEKQNLPLGLCSLWSLSLWYPFLLSSLEQLVSVQSWKRTCSVGGFGNLSQ